MKKFILAAFFWGIGFGTAVFLITYLTLLYFNKDTEKTFAIKDSTIDIVLPRDKSELDKTNPDYEFPYTNCYKLLISNHRAHLGRNLILTLERENFGSFSMHDETFEKLSVELNSNRVGKYKLPSDKVKVFYSISNTASVHHCGGYFGTEAEGIIEIIDITDKEISANISLTIHSTLARDLKTNKTYNIDYFGQFKLHDGLPK
ncbi:hypothetical protein [Pleionea sediminis]|uniref:hypothetical protein n=1 Tax=Pleionea sediminis TaxID=2569479 RepID=UPI0011848E20|nr:hypothetical protein [Pleionea sediminis]